MSTPIKAQMNIEDLSLRAQAYGIRGESMDGNDAIAIYEAALEAKAYVLHNGPMLLVLNTYRHMGHSKSDPQNYRTKDEVEAWKKRDPFVIMRSRLIAEASFTAAELDAMDDQAVRDIAKAVEYAEASPEPLVEEALRDIYAE